MNTTQASGRFLEQHWLEVLESLEDGLIVVDQQGRIAYLNEGAAGLTGLSSAHALGQPVSQLLAANRWLAELIDTTRISNVRNVCADSVLHVRGQRPRPVRAAATLLVDSQGKSLGSLLTLQDQSTQQELESRSREADRLGHLEILLAGLAHEIKNPLSGMRGAAQLLATAGPSAERSRECTQIIVEEIDRLNRLMTQLLDLTGPARFDRAPVNVHELVDRVLAIEGTGAGERMRFVRRYDPSLPPVLGDAGRLTQVFLNLVRNAVEASPPTGTVTVTTRMETSYYVAGAHGREQFLTVEVSDQGPGIPAEDLRRIFSPFFTTKSGGTGLGLAISQRIVTEHGGVLRARSEPGEGTIFSTTLPVERPTRSHHA